MPYAEIRRRLEAGGVVLLDGPTGTELQRRGADMNDDAWCGPASLAAPDLLTDIHADYIGIGCDVITANTFASSRLMLESAGLGDQVEAANWAAVEAALRARERADAGRPVAIAGALSHMVPVARGTGRSDESRVPGREQVAAAFRELAGLLADAGCDLIILEMMYHPERIPLALDAARATGLPVWMGLSARQESDGELLSFYQHEDIPFDEIAALIPPRDVDAAGVMHTDVRFVGEAVRRVRAHFPGPLLAYPDAGTFRMPHWQFVDVDPAHFRDYCREWIAGGVQIIGGCCGLTPEHIRAVADLKTG